MALQWRSKCINLRNPTFVQLFSSSPSSSSPPPSDESNDGEGKKESSSPSAPSFSSYFSDVKSSLNLSSAPRRVSPYSSKETPSFTARKHSKVASLEEIHKNLPEIRLRSAAPPPSEKLIRTSSQAISFQDLYKRNVIEKSEGENDKVGSGKSGKPSFDAIHESLRQLRASSGSQPSSDRFGGTGGRAIDPMSLSALRSSLKLQPQEPSSTWSFVVGGSKPLPSSIFGKEWRAKEAELLMKLREIEDKETESKIGGVSFKDLRESLVRLQMSDENKTKRSSIHRLDILGQLGGTPNFMLLPPKEHLVEKQLYIIKVKDKLYNSNPAFIHAIATPVQHFPIAAPKNELQNTWDPLITGFYAEVIYEFIHKLRWSFKYSIMTDEVTYV
ncbi:hypothetical protein NE237_011168 [Protea cynaroides]|uniref:Uncharacterized protein n=1 Tax=Protea cynaroides TaxID=273540 RepID=A0A9Q0GXN8_9MAGN|nr:hypothetical protein NE237_011168 [Protea cynaroides]